PSDLLIAPEVEGAFAGMVPAGFQAVRILRRIEAAERIGHLATDVLQRVVRDVREEIVTRRLRALEEREHELRLVVEHLLEVRHAPAGIDGIAVKAAADVIAHPALRDRTERSQDHVQGGLVSGPRVLAQQEQELAWPRKLRRVAEPA